VTPLSNIRTPDRFLRATIAILSSELGYFWLASPYSWLAFAIAAVLAVTAVLGFCPLYAVLGIKAKASTRGSLLKLGTAVVALALIAGAGAYGSIFFSRKFFLEDFNAMNNFYKQALFLSGKEDRDGAVQNLDSFLTAFSGLRSRYENYRPYDLKGDTAFNSDLAGVAQILLDAAPLVRTGDLHEAHLALEKVRPVFQGILKRNGFSMLAVALVDFHDAMETMLAAANAKDAAKLLSLKDAVGEKLAAVESQATDTDIAAIRKAFETLVSAAMAGDSDTLPEKGETLKASFVKVYLQRG